MTTFRKGYFPPFASTFCMASPVHNNPLWFWFEVRDLMQDGFQPVPGNVEFRNLQDEKFHVDVKEKEL